MSFFITLFTTYKIFVYAPIIFGMFIEGTVTLLIFGALSHNSNINFMVVLPLAIVGELIHDSVFWLVGNKIKKMHNRKFLCIDPEKISKFLGKMKNSFGIYIFISKFIWNFNRLTVISTGYAGMKFRNFIKASFVASTIWSISLLSIGYAFAEHTKLLKQEAWLMGILLISIFILITLLEFLLRIVINKYMEINGNGNINEKQKSLFSKITKR